MQKNIERQISNTLNTQADQIISSNFKFPGYPTTRLPQNLSWAENPFHDPSWNYFLNVMGYTRTLTNAYELSNKIKYLKHAEELIIDWISDNSSYLFKPNSRYAWNDQTTALRLINWLYFWEMWAKSPLFNPSEMKLVLSSMISHANRLADPKFHTYRHNHGIDQDIALLSMTYVFPEIKKSKEWRLTALKRLKDQISFAVSRNGIQLEHSPRYQLYGLFQLLRVRKLLKLTNLENSFNIDLDSIILKMIHYLKYIVMPNGKLAPVGDTGAESIKEFSDQLDSLKQEDKGLLYLLTDGKFGFLADTAVAFPDEGYAIIRDLNKGKLSYQKSFYLFFTAASHKGHGHKHFDDLSFLLSYGGYDLLTDAGAYTYKADKFRSYVVSTAAHNTITIDGMNFKGWDTTFDKFKSDSLYTIIKASHRNYPGFECSRKLIRIYPNVIIIVDDIKPYGKKIISNTQIHKFEQLFHTEKNIKIKVNSLEREVWFFVPNFNEPAMRILQLEIKPTNIDVLKGNKDPIQGWVTKSRGIMEPAPVVSFEQKGKSTSFITALELNKSLPLKNKNKMYWSNFTYNANQKIINISNNKNSIWQKVSIDLNNMKINFEK